LDLSKFDGLSGETLRDALRNAEGPGRVMSYRRMRALAFGGVLAGPNGQIQDVYTEATLKPGPIPSAKRFNWEHIVPQSWNNLRRTMFRGHMFNGLISDSFANNKRGHEAFGEVVPGSVEWERDGCRLGHDVHGREVFEPRSSSKGLIALRTLWMYTEAPQLMPAQYKFELATMVRWAIEHPVTDLKDRIPLLRAEVAEDESLYYAHANRAFILRAFVDVLEQFKDESPENQTLYQEALKVVQSSH
jgi:hypothetical protein